MNLEREFKTLKTSFGTEYKIKLWLTKGERMKIEDVVFSKADIDPTNPENLKLKGGENFLSEMQQANIEAVVVEINGQSENVFGIYCHEIREDDANEIMAEVEKVLKPVDKKK